MPETPEIRRKRLKFQSGHRGMREADLVLGRFADACLDRMSEAELNQYEKLLGVPDADLLDWLMGRSPAPADYDALMERIKGSAS